MMYMNQLMERVREKFPRAEIKEFPCASGWTAYAIIEYHEGMVSFDALTPLMPTARLAWECAEKSNLAGNSEQRERRLIE